LASSDGDDRVELSVVVPIYGCTECLDVLHERLTSSLARITPRFELIFIDDRSPDAAWESLVELAHADPAVRAFRLSRNFGQDAAITAGLGKARGRWTVVMDCDLQEAPEDIPRLYARAQEGFDIVRTLRRTRGHSWLRRLASRVYRIIMLEGDDRPEYSTLSLISDRVVAAYLSMGDRDREYTLVLDWLGFTHSAIDIDYHKRAAGKSTYTLRRLVRLAVDGMFFRTTVLLRWIVMLGFLIAITGAGLAAYDIYSHLFHGGFAGYTSLAVLLLLLVGFVIISLGVVGLYVGRIFEQVKGRPLFIIDAAAGLHEEPRRDASGATRGTARPVASTPSTAAESSGGND
jgi:dolichol-phosphate mannosyltransferase